MRGLKRNEADIRHRPFLRNEDARDENGLLTGEKVKLYGDSAPIRGSVSDASGQVSQQLFGTSQDYDYVILSHEKDLVVKEDDLILLGDVTCVVKRISPSLNVLAIAVRQVNADGP